MPLSSYQATRTCDDPSTDTGGPRLTPPVLPQIMPCASAQSGGSESLWRTLYGRIEGSGIRSRSTRNIPEFLPVSPPYRN